MHPRTSYAEWLCDHTSAAQLRGLTDEERSAIDRGYREHESRAREIAKRVVKEKKMAEEVVEGATARMVYAALRGAAPIPQQLAEFGRRFRGYVRNVAREVVRGSDYAPPRHAFWLEAPAPVSHRKVTERPLRRDFDDIDLLKGELALPDDGDAFMPVSCPAYRQPSWPKPHPTVMTMDLIWILEAACEMLPFKQRLVVGCTLEDAGRDIVSNVMGIAPKTYDTHFARAKVALRKILLQFKWDCPNVDEWGDPIGGTHRSQWNEIFAEMEERRLAREVRLQSAA